MSTPKTIQALAVELALDEQGYKEGRRNWTKYAERSYPDVQNQAWCGTFIGDSFIRAGWDPRGIVWMPYVPYIESWAKKIGAWKTDRAQLGDIVVYGFGRTSGQHTGLAYPDESTGGDSYRAVEGNTSSGDRGSQSNGDGVYVRYRKRRDIRGWVDMDKVFEHYNVKADLSLAESSKPRPKPAVGKRKHPRIAEDSRFGTKSVKALQVWLNEEHDAGLKVDGKMGHNTIRALQRALGTPVDGKVSNQSRRASSLGNGITQGWDYDGPGSSGSTMVRALQKLIGAKVDGVWGPKTTLALQEFLNKELAA